MHELEHFPSTDGTQLALRILGHGQPLIFLHGWTSNHRDWIHFQTGLQQHYRSYAWDARAHGASASDSAPTLTQMVADLAALIRHYHLQRPVLIGHSMGALIAWAYIQAHGCQNLSGLVVIDQSPKLVTDASWPYGIYGDFSAQRNQQFIQELRTDFAEAVLLLGARGLNQAFSQRYAQEPERFDRYRAQLRLLNHPALTECWCSLTAADLRPALAKIDIPTLLVYGEHSQFYSAHTAAWVQAQIKTAELHEYPAMDHSPHIWQRERFLNDLSTFLSTRVWG